MPPWRRDPMLLGGCIANQENCISLIFTTFVPIKRNYDENKISINLDECRSTYHE